MQRMTLIVHTNGYLDSLFDLAICLTFIVLVHMYIETAHGKPNSEGNLTWLVVINFGLQKNTVVVVVFKWTCKKNLKLPRF